MLRTVEHERPDLLHATNFGRCRQTAETIARLSEQRANVHTPLTSVIVGIGKDAGPIEQPYEPYLVHTKLNAPGIPFSLTLIDRDSEVLDLIVKRRRMFLPQANGLLGSVDRDNAWWQEFLAETGQTDAVIHEPIDELMFLPTCPRGTGSRFMGTDDHLSAGFRVTNVPDAFVEGLTSGSIQLIHADIATFLPASCGNTYSISCRNVLCHLEPEDQAMAIWNMSRMLIPGGHILVNDFEDHNTPSMLEEYCGWLSEDILQRDFSLTMTVLSKHEAYHYSDLLLTKL